MNVSFLFLCSDSKLTVFMFWTKQLLFGRRLIPSLFVRQIQSTQGHMITSGPFTPPDWGTPHLEPTE